MKRYEVVEHTADVAVKAYGGSLKELFTSAVLAMFAVMIAKKKNRPEGSLTEVVFEKTGEDLEELLKAWLDEFLFYFSAKQLVLHRIKSLEFVDNSFKAVVLLDCFDKDCFDLGCEIKAVTYHELKIEKTKHGWQAFIIFDV